MCYGDRKQITDILEEQTACYLFPRTPKEHRVHEREFIWYFLREEIYFHAKNLPTLLKILVQIEKEKVEYSTTGEGNQGIHQNI